MTRSCARHEQGIKMVNNNEIMEQVEKMCGKVILLDNGWIHFVYHNYHYINIPDSRNGFVRFTIPHLARSCDYSKNKLESVVNETNREVKYVKVVILANGSIALNYDHKIIGEEKAKDVVPHMIKALDAASMHLFSKL